MQELIELGLYIGVTGDTLETEETLFALTQNQQILMDKMLIGTDSPYACMFEDSHAGFKYVSTKFEDVIQLGDRDLDGKRNVPIHD